MSMEAVNWSEVLAIFTLLSGVAGIIFMLLRTRLSTIFVTRHEHAELVERVNDMDERVAKLPSHADIGALTEKVSTVSRDVAVVGATVDGASRSISRVEHMMDMLMKNQLDREAAR
jgi:hypothetical protein